MVLGVARFDGAPGYSAAIDVHWSMFHNFTSFAYSGKWVNCCPLRSRMTHVAVRGRPVAAEQGIELTSSDFVESPGYQSIQIGPKALGKPRAKWWGILPIGEAEIPVYVLDNGVRVISRTAATGILTDKKGGGNLQSYLGVEALVGYIPPDLPGLLVDFEIDEVVNKQVQGFSAESFIEVCQAYVKAHSEGALTTDRQREIAICTTTRADGSPSGGPFLHLNRLEAPCLL